MLNVALIAEGTYPYHPGGVSVWCDQLVRGMAPHRFSIHSIIAGDEKGMSWPLPDNVDGFHPIPLWSPVPKQRCKARTSRELGAIFEQLVTSMVQPDGEHDFLDALYKLYTLSQETPLIGALSSKASLASLLDAMRSAGPEGRTMDGAPVPVTIADARTALDLIERQLRPLFCTPPEADLCHATANGLAVLPALSAFWEHQTPLVLSEHGIYLRERYLSYGPRNYPHAVRSIMLRFFKRITWVGYQVASAIAPGSEYNRFWQQANGADGSRIHPVYNGVDVGSFVTSPSEPDVPTLSWLGRIDPLKDVETLLRAFVHVRDVLPAARLRIFGAASAETKSYLDRCMALRDSLDLEGSATFEGRADSVLDAYHAGHVVLLTSISEGFPYTLIEAMAAGKPIVATDVGGVREATGNAGLVVPPQNPVKMADACLMLLGDADLRRTIGQAARARILSMFTVEQSLAVFGDLYRDVTGRVASAQLVQHEQERRDATALPALPAAPDVPLTRRAPVSELVESGAA